MFTVYCLTGPAGKRYIGVSKRLSGRLRNHRHIAKSGERAGHPLYRAISKHGFGAFTVSVLATFECLEEARAAEIRAIAEYRTLTPGGYNLSIGGNYDGESGGAAVREKLRTDAAYLAHRRDIGRREAWRMHVKSERDQLVREVATWRPGRKRKEAQRRLAEIDRVQLQEPVGLLTEKKTATR